MVFFITGASSFIGIEICRYLTDCGHRVIAISRRNNEQLQEIAAGGRLRVLRVDMKHLADLAEVERADVFIHLAWAGTSREDRNDPAIQQENLQFSLESVRLASQIGCVLYMDAGSQAEYGIVEGPVSEETTCNPLTAYGKNKLLMYRKTAVLTEALRLKYIHLRIFSVYGENDHADTLIMSSLRKLMAGEPVVLRSGGQMWNYVYVKDVARQMGELAVFAVKEEGFLSPQVYHIASDDSRKLMDFVVAMKHVTGSSSELHFGGYEKGKDVYMEPSVTKTGSVVKPVSMWIFEDVIKEMASLVRQELT